MPRIPSISEMRPVSPAVDRDPGLYASADSFGLGVTQGVAEVGREIVNAAPQLRKLVEKVNKSDAAEETVQIGNHKSKVRELSTQMVDDQGYDGGSPLEFAKRAEEELSRLEDEMLKTLSPQRRAPARQATEAIRRGHGLRAAQHQQNQKVAALERETAETLSLLQSQAAAEPAAAEMLSAEGLELLRQLYEAGALSDRQLEQQSTAFRRELYSELLHSQSAIDVVADLEAGLYDEQLGDPMLKDRLLTANRWRLQGELVQGRASGAELVAREARGEAALPALSEATRAILAAADHADFVIEAQKARRIREAIESLRFAPEAALDAEIEKLTPGDDALDKPARLEIQEAMRRGCERFLEERRCDPAGYVMGQTALATLFAAAKDDPALLPAALASRLAAQEAMDIAPEDQRLLSQAEVSGILAGYQASSKQAKLEAIMTLRDKYGDESGRVATELEEAGLPPLVSYLLDPSGNTASARLMAAEPQLPASGPERDIIDDTAARLLAE